MQVRSHSFAVLLAALGLTSTTVAQSYNWVQNPANGHFYTLTAPLRWQDAEFEAQRLGGNLVAITSTSEQQWIEATFGQSPATQPMVWIGLRQARLFGWSSGERLVYTHCCQAGGCVPVSALPYYAMRFTPAAAYPCGFGDWWPCPVLTVLPGVVEVPFDPRTPPPARVSPFGSACGTHGFIPYLRPEPGSLPRIGAIFKMQFGNLPSGPQVSNFGLLGMSNTRIPGGPLLPLDLSALGAPGCDLLVSAESAYPNGSSSRWWVTIPPFGSLAGASVFVQIVTVAPGANALGLAVTNGLQVTMGS